MVYRFVARTPMVLDDQVHQSLRPTIMGRCQMREFAITALPAARATPQRYLDDSGK